MSSGYPKRTDGLRKRALLASIAAVACCAYGPFAFGQSSTQSVFVSSTAPIDAKPTSGRAPTSAKANRETGVITIGDVLFSGSLIAGGVYNDNLYASRFNKTSDFGFNLAPSFKLRRDAGLHSTTMAGWANSQFYANNSNANVLTGALSMNHVYEVQRDLIVFLQGRVARNLNQTARVVNPTLNLQPAYFNEQVLSGSIEKSFDRLSVGLGGTYLAQQNFSVEDTLGRRYYRGGRDGQSQTVVGRIGYAITPVFQVFLRPAYNWQSFGSRVFDSQGYSVTAGIRSDRIGLFRGEIYAGHQQQTYDNLNRSSSAPTFGGSISWFPTRDWTFTATLSQSYGLTEGEAFQGGTSQITRAALLADYAFSDRLDARASVSYSIQDGVTFLGDQEVLNVGGSLNYMFSAHLGLNLGYDFTNVTYTNRDGGYQRNLVKVGANARF